MVAHRTGTRTTLAPPSNRTRMSTSIASPLAWLAGAAASGVVAALAYRLRSLTISGAWAATACGVILYGAGGWAWVALVGMFFVTSSGMTHIEGGWAGSRSRSLDRLGRRWDQVAANGGVATLTAVIHGLTGSPLTLVAAAGAVAAAAADTWGTEIGRWSRVSPRLITTWASVPHGTSGGITPVGTIGAAAGAAVIGWLAALLGAGFQPAHLAVGVAAAGFLGALLDSVLGATIEGRWKWVGNGVVNALATAWGAGLALLAASAGW